MLMAVAPRSPVWSSTLMRVSGLQLSCGHVLCRAFGTRYRILGTLEVTFTEPSVGQGSSGRSNPRPRAAEATLQANLDTSGMLSRVLPVLAPPRDEAPRLGRSHMIPSWRAHGEWGRGPRTALAVEPQRHIKKQGWRPHRQVEAQRLARSVDASYSSRFGSIKPNLAFHDPCSNCVPHMS
jgi:hypothetical protein